MLDVLNKYISEDKLIELLSGVKTTSGKKNKKILSPLNLNSIVARH